MSTHKHIDIICLAGALLALLLCGIFSCGETFGIQQASKVLGYEDRLFDTSQVHTIDIVMDDWDSFIATCENEEYAVCSVVIDGEAYSNVGIRAKGNTSLSTVSSMSSDRYSFKIEFDQYDSTKNYHGLDKLSLNNLIQDSTMMKDYLTYQLMGEFGAAAPLCSYAYITVNGEDWGLYLAVEAVEDSFLQRNYGNDYGELYKPDSLSMGGGGPGNGRNFQMDEFMDANQGAFSWWGQTDNDENQTPEQSVRPEGGMPGGRNNRGKNLMDRSTPSDTPTQNSPDDASQELDPQLTDTESLNTEPQDGQTDTDHASEQKTESPQMPDGFEIPEFSENAGGGNRFSGAPNMKQPGNGSPDMGGGMGSNDVKLQYIDDDPDSYSNIFDQAKTDISEADQARLIQALKSLSEGDAIESAVDIDKVLRYFVVHNFVVNGDSYTGSMVHNYYLYEENGLLSMIPWDYNLAFGTFQGNDAGGAVNDPIDTPLSVSGSGDRPMADWIFSSEEYTRLYHQYFEEFLNQVDFTALIDTTAELIAPYVEKDPSKFYTTTEFNAGVETLHEFCLLREESVLGQLNGTIPSTDTEQNADSSALVDASHITLSDMGSMNMGGGRPGGQSSRNERAQNDDAPITPADARSQTNVAASGFMPGAMNPDQTESTQEIPDVQGQPGNFIQDTGRSFRPENAAGQMPAVGGENPMNSTGKNTQGSSTILMMAFSGVVLLLGLVVAKKYRR